MLILDPFRLPAADLFITSALFIAVRVGTGTDTNFGIVGNYAEATYIIA